MNPSTIFNYIYNAYQYLVQIISHLLQITIFQADPSIASEYAQFISILIPITAVYIILSVIEIARKIIGYIVLFMWILLIVLMIISR